MKSVMQEASTIAKALEQAWIQAGKPEEFTIKILEQPEKNFLGFVKRSAKVALYFEEKKNLEKKPIRQAVRHPRQDRKEVPSRESRERSEEREPHRETPKREVQHQHRENQRQPQPRQQREWRNQQQRPQRRPEHEHDRQEKVESLSITWSDEMTSFAQSWMRETLESMRHGHVFFTVEPQNLYLRIALHEQLMSNPEEERQVLASFATLLLEALKKHFNAPMQGHKIVLTHATAYEKYSR